MPLHKQPKTQNKDSIVNERYIKFSLIIFGLSSGIQAQRTLNLDSCRTLALSNNKELRMSKEKVNAAHYQQKAAFTNFLPKIDMMGTYMRTERRYRFLAMTKSQLSAI